MVHPEFPARIFTLSPKVPECGMGNAIHDCFGERFKDTVVAIPRVNIYVINPHELTEVIEMPVCINDIILAHRFQFAVIAFDNF
jgi:hypothetical protein